jgi:beta-N-acetylhexosaminidase
MTTLEEKIGQIMMVGLEGEALTQEEEGSLAEHPFGGFILFSHNLREPDQILALCRSLWEKSKQPPFIAIDQEGGRVHRLPAPFTHFPPAAVLGRTRNRDLAYRVGLATARELSAAGLNLNFAPVLDVNSNPHNPVIRDRSLSSDPQEAAVMGLSIVQGLRDGDIIPCGKHFPGHGDTAHDSHLELPKVAKEKSSLETVELPPFIQASQKRIESMMTAHVLYPALDSQYPATLSRSIIGDLLRQELGYKGVVFSDDLEMKAISRNYSDEEASLLAVRAGVDVLLFCHDRERATKASVSLCREAEKDRQIKARIEESYERITRLKERYLRSFTGNPESLRKSIESPDHKKLVAEIQGNR